MKEQEKQQEVVLKLTPQGIQACLNAFDKVPGTRALANYFEASMHNQLKPQPQEMVASKDEPEKIVKKKK
jgi:hypothetical protein